MKMLSKFLNKLKPANFLKKCGILIFPLEDYYEEAGFKRAVKADAAYSALWDIGQEIFRPARKHGYNDKKLNDLLDAYKVPSTSGYGDYDYPAYEVVSMLEDKFYEILSENGINLDEDYL